MAPPFPWHHHALLRHFSGAAKTQLEALFSAPGAAVTLSAGQKELLGDGEIFFVTAGRVEVYLGDRLFISRRVGEIVGTTREYAEQLGHVSIEAMVDSAGYRVKRAGFLGALNLASPVAVDTWKVLLDEADDLLRKVDRHYENFEDYTERRPRRLLWSLTGRPA